MIRKAIHAGTFYPRFGNQIKDQIEQWLLKAAPAVSNERSVGIILPHAGYMYSGECAALGMAEVAHEHFDSIIVIHPSHQGNHFDFALSPYTEYESPLGNLNLDTELYQRLSVTAEQNLDPDYHLLEHSLEIQLPLIKYFFPQSRILPILMGNQIPQVASRLARILYDAIYKSSKRILVLVSTDLSHYHPASRAEQMDARVIEYVSKLDADGLWRSAELSKLEACGIGGILTLLKITQNYSMAKVRIVQYTHSGKISGMNNQVVGYLAAKIFV